MADQELTLKQRKWLDVYMQCGNATEAAMQAYDCQDRNSAKVIGSENLSKLNFAEFLEDAGISDNLLRKKIEEGLDADRTISANVTIKSDDPTIKNRKANGRDVDFIDVPDYATRHKYLETALKVKGKLIDKTESTVKLNISKVEVEFISGSKAKDCGSVELPAHTTSAL